LELNHRVAARWAIPLGARHSAPAGQVAAHNDLTVAVLRHVRIGNKLSVGEICGDWTNAKSRNLMGERPLWRGLANA